MATLQSLSFVPTSISGCSLWLDSTDLSSFSLTGTSVTEWRDKSGNNKNFTATTGNPSLINDGGRNVLDFPSGVVMSSSSTITFTSTPFFFVVAKVASISAAGLSMLLSVGTDYSIRFNANGLGGTAATPGNTGDLGNSNYYVTGNFNPNYALSVYTSNYNIIGTAVASNGGGTSTFTLSSTFLSRFFIGRISEVILYPTLTVAQRQQVEGYLAWKWGIQSLLPSSHPYYYFAPNSAGLGYPSNLRIPVQVQSFLPSSSPLVLFNPLSLAGCSLWLDGMSGVTNNVWPDKSPSRNNATRTGGTITTTTVNNAQALSFSSASMTYANNLIFLGTTGSSCFIVAAPTTSGVHLLRSEMAGLGSLYLWTDATLYENIGFSTRQVINGFSSGVLQIYSNIANRTSNSLIFRNGTQIFSTTYGSGYTSLTYSVNSWTGTVCEILIYTRTLTLSEQQQVEGYLAWKWGLQASLPSNSPYKNGVPGGIVNISIPGQFMLPASFSPVRVSGIQMWLDGADPLGTGTAPANGASIASWVDKSGVGNNATAGTAPSFNSTGINNLGVISFNGSTTFLNSQDLYSNRSFSIFIVQRRQAANSGGSSALMGGTGTSANNNMIIIFTAFSLRFAFYSNDLDYTSFPSYTGNTATEPAYLMEFTYTPGSRNIFVNGTNVASDTNSTNVASDTSPRIGTWSTGGSSNSYTGFMGEIIVLNGTPATSSRQQIEGYLAWKWGLQGNLPANHPFKRFPPPPN